MCLGFSQFLGTFPHFVMAKLANSSIRVNNITLPQAIAESYDVTQCMVEAEWLLVCFSGWARCNATIRV